MSFCSTSPLQCSFLPWWDCLQCYLWVSDIPYKILVRNLMTGVWRGRWRPWWEERIRATQIWRSRTSIQGTFVSFCFFNLLSCYSICYYSVDFRPDNRAYELKHTGSLHFAFDLTYQWVSPLFKPLFSFFCVSSGWGSSFVFTVCCWFWTLNNLIVCWSINSIHPDLNVTFKVLL
jgi:hypothetical protein